MVEQNPEDAGRPGVLVQLPLFLLCGLSAAIAAQETCRADIDAKCGDAASNDCEGKFFPGFTKINYEGPTSKRALAYKWYNIEEVILIKKMKGTAMLWVDKEKREINEKARRNWQNHDKGRALQ
ncbi:xylose isomerase isoform X4 [Aegilops tauschii subsp. strangulata]|uniref:xylose isomerase isoform X4 n=1 Tax=Aegilops tauschii subsp. strangulata TaxID=200361 RepID=UPI003CC8895D